MKTNCKRGKFSCRFLVLLVVVAYLLVTVCSCFVLFEPLLKKNSTKESNKESEYLTEEESKSNSESVGETSSEVEIESEIFSSEESSFSESDSDDFEYSEFESELEEESEEESESDYLVYESETESEEEFESDYLEESTSEEESESEKEDESVVTSHYTIKFITNSDSVIASQEIEENGIVSVPKEPTKENYKFVGWYLKGNLYDFNSPIKGDIELVAKWEVLKSINGFIGKWTAHFTTQSEEIRILTINSSVNGTFEIINDYGITYDVTQVLYYANIVEIYLEKDDISICLKLKVEGKTLICVDPITEEEIVFYKEK